jgi:hypothetical protein
LTLVKASQRSATINWLIEQGELGYETSRLLDGPADAFGRDQPSTRAGSGKEYLLGVSRNPKRAASLSEFEGTNLGRDCKHSWSDRSGLAPDAYDASCGDADVLIEPRTKTTNH